MHVGPTNSGKTYNAMQRLKTATSGVYCGPLRLLAHEIYERLNEEGVPCNLVTGEMKRVVPNVNLLSCTVEMAPLDKPIDVAIIDEIQMIADQQRGFAWTNALLGIAAREIHVCGEESAVPLVEKLCEWTGDEVEINRYERLGELKVEEETLSDVRELKKGDCVIAFSRRDIFAIKKDIEVATRHKCALVYGRLPPEVRSEQAKLFNAGETFDVLVASDAVGMGLNLNIRRIIFDRMEKTISGKLSVSQVKQIAGRAGRFGSTFDAGLVTTMDTKDLRYLKNCMKASVPSLEQAGLSPMYSQLEAFHKKLPKERFSNLLDQFERLAVLDGDFFLCNMESMKTIAEAIENLTLSLHDRYVFCIAPVSHKNEEEMEFLRKLAKTRANGRICSITELIDLPQAPPVSIVGLKDLEAKHKCIMIYMWLANRMTETFVDMEGSLALKSISESFIQDALLNLEFKRKRKHHRKTEEDEGV